MLILWVVDLKHAAGTDGRMRNVARPSYLEALVNNCDHAVALAWWVKQALKPMARGSGDPWLLQKNK